MFADRHPCIDLSDLESLLADVKTAYDAGIRSIANNQTHLTNWDLYSSIFFASTIVTTIGKNY